MFKYMTKREAEKLVRDLDKKEPTVSGNGDVIVQIAVPFRVGRGKWLILMDQSITHADTMITDFRMKYLNHTVYGESQEDCLMKIIACLTGDLLNDKK